MVCWMMSRAEIRAYAICCSTYVGGYGDAQWCGSSRPHIMRVAQAPTSNYDLASNGFPRNEECTIVQQAHERETSLDTYDASRKSEGEWNKQRRYTDTETERSKSGTNDMTI